MAWTNPITWVFKQVWSATLFNEQIRDNFNYLKNRPYDLALLGSSNQGSISTTWVKVTNSELQVILPTTAVLEFQWRVIFTHTLTTGALRLDILDVDTGLYLSSGTTTPVSNGLGAVVGSNAVGSAVNNVGWALAIGVPAGTHNYELWVSASAATATIVNNVSKNAFMVKEIA